MNQTELSSSNTPAPKRRAWKIRAEYRLRDSMQQLLNGNVRLDYGVAGLLPGMSRAEILSRVRETYTSSTSKRISDHTGQLYRLLTEIQVGDLILVPFENGSRFFIGTVWGAPRILESTVVNFRVDWMRTDVALLEFDQDLRFSFMAIMRVCEVARNEAPHRLELVGNRLPDPRKAVPL